MPTANLVDPCLSRSSSAGAPLIARGVLTGKTIVWYVNWRLERV